MNVVVARHLTIAAAIAAAACGQPASSSSTTGLGVSTAGTTAAGRGGAGGVAAATGVSGGGAGVMPASSTPAVSNPPVLPAPAADEFPNVDCRSIQAEAPGAELGAAPSAPAAGGGGRGGMSGGGMSGGGMSASGASAGKAGSAAGSGGASTGGNAGAGASVGAAPTLDDVAMVLRCEGCDSSFCHGGVAGFKVSSTRSEMYEMLLGPDGMGAPTGTAESGGLCSGMKRVVPGDPEHSVLYLKIAQHQPCGASMPPAGEARMISGFFNARELEVVRAWIAAGAKK